MRLRLTGTPHSRSTDAISRGLRSRTDLLDTAPQLRLLAQLRPHVSSSSMFCSGEISKLISTADLRAHCRPTALGRLLPFATENTSGQDSPMYSGWAGTVVVLICRARCLKVYGAKLVLFGHRVVWTSSRTRAVLARPQCALTVSAVFARAIPRAGRSHSPQDATKGRDVVGFDGQFSLTSPEPIS